MCSITAIYSTSASSIYAWPLAHQGLRTAMGAYRTATTRTRGPEASVRLDYLGTRAATETALRRNDNSNLYFSIYLLQTVALFS